MVFLVIDQAGYVAGAYPTCEKATAALAHLLQDGQATPNAAVVGLSGYTLRQGVEVKSTK